MVVLWYNLSNTSIRMSTVVTVCVCVSKTTAENGTLATLPLPSKLTQNTSLIFRHTSVDFQTTPALKNGSTAIQNLHTLRSAIQYTDG